MILTHKLGRKKEIAKLITKNNKEFFVYRGDDFLIRTLKIVVFYSEDIHEIIDKLGELNEISTRTSYNG